MSDNWKPKIWVAVLLGIFLGSSTFLYLNKPKLFWIYFFPVLAASAVSWYVQLPISLVFSIICPVHAYILAKDYDPSSMRGWYSLWWGIPAIYAAIFLPIFAVRSFLYEPFSMPSRSMQPTLNVGDYIIVKKLGFGGYGTFGLSLLNTGISENTNIQRGKVYVFYPPHKDVPFVKRLIAIPGDTVELQGKQLFVNGLLLDTTLMYETEFSAVYEETLDKTSYLIQRISRRPSIVNKKIVVPANNYFFLGDNRDNSMDSRVWGTVANDRFLGEVVHVFSK